MSGPYLSLPSIVPFRVFPLLTTHIKLSMTGHDGPRLATPTYLLSLTLQPGTHWTSLPGEHTLPSTHNRQEPSLRTQAWHGPPPQACPVLPKRRQRPYCMLQSTSFFPITVYVCFSAVRFAESGDRVYQFALRRVLNTCFSICASLIQTTNCQQTRNDVWTTLWVALARGVVVTGVQTSRRIDRLEAGLFWEHLPGLNLSRRATDMGEMAQMCTRAWEICYCKGSRMGTQWHSW